MTREVINELKKYTAKKKNTEKVEISVLALNRLISALEEQEFCEDYISRQEVLDQIYLWSKDEFLRVTNPFDYLQKRINSLSPVIPQPKIGHWLIVERSKSDREVICSNCKQPILKYHKLDCDYRPKYCPNCGYYMHD